MGAKLEVSHFERLLSVGPKREEDGSWRNLHNDELHRLYSLLNIVSLIKSRRMRSMGHVAHMGEQRDIYRVLVGRPKWKKLVGKPRHRWGYSKS
jgi:hypothetical protein